jgi:hypothetical protein
LCLFGAQPHRLPLFRPAWSEGLNMSATLAARYLRFAAHEVHGRSPLYEEIACAIASDAEVLAFLQTLPDEKRQPNLLLAAVRHLFGTAPDWPSFRACLLADPAAVRDLMLQRATQTNEPAGCATLLPVLARLPQPLALIEVGASAGLCLLPDHYGYDYGRASIPRRDGAAPVFACAVDAATPLPAAVPQIIWRAGLDLNPLDVSDPAHVAWLETLVWPEQTTRLSNLRKAIAVAAKAKPRLHEGDLLGDDLARLCGQAPRDATRVIFHTAVLGYVARPAARQQFARRVTSLCDVWVSNEPPGVFPDMAGRLGSRRGRLLLAVNGAPVAWSDPHGASLEWIEHDACAGATRGTPA